MGSFVVFDWLLSFALLNLLLLLPFNPRFPASQQLGLRAMSPLGLPALSRPSLPLCSMLVFLHNSMIQQKKYLMPVGQIA
ncbi:hypothetical protein CLU79DRAFT_783357 [Phycomyces nitens]|nr:hypothetical protein CLU79DRAFT_783357 [Phycomyces nitens]